MWEHRRVREGFDARTIKWYKRNKKTLPDWIVHDEPPLLPGDIFYFRAFSELSTCRQFGSVHGPIPWDRVYLYGSRYRLDFDMMRVFEIVIRELDEAYLKDQRDVQEKEDRARERAKEKKS